MNSKLTKRPTRLEKAHKKAQKVYDDSGKDSDCELAMKAGYAVMDERSRRQQPAKVEAPASSELVHPPMGNVHTRMFINAYCFPPEYNRYTWYVLLGALAVIGAVSGCMYLFSLII
ncbi:MAG: hypothetical protein JWO54_745 [Candidatus Saccharibacteria bacterium]|nr:hypothetical protein [Candidatus Saccharibacteria bacterium]